MITRDPLKRLDGHHLDVFVRTEQKEEEEEVKKVSSRVKRTEGAWTVSGKQRDGVGSNFAAPPNMRERETPTQAQYHTQAHSTQAHSDTGTVPHRHTAHWHSTTPRRNTSSTNQQRIDNTSLLQLTLLWCRTSSHCAGEVKRAWAT